MLKSKFASTIFVTLAMCAAIVACGGQAHAALPDSFIADAATHRVFSIEHVMSVEQVNGPSTYTVNVKYLGGYGATFEDPNGTVWNKIVARMTVSNVFVQVPGTKRWINTNMYIETSCNVGTGQSAILWPGFPGTEYINDGCGFYNSVKAVSQ